MIFRQAKAWGLIRPYPEETISWRKALIEPGRAVAQVKLAPLSEPTEADIRARRWVDPEVTRIVLKLEQMAGAMQHEGVAKMIAEEMESILVAIRMVKDRTTAAFQGILGAGANLDIMWLRPKDVGGSLLNPAGTAGLGLYGGTSGGVFTWLNTFTANTSDDLIPEQKMAKVAGVIHLGAIDLIEVPKLNTMLVTLAGIPAPAQGLPFNVREGFGVDKTPFVRFEKPIIVGPARMQRIDVMPNISGSSKFQLLTLLIAEAQNLVM